MVDLNDFYKEINCTYKEEHYNVRDNGAVLRNPRVNSRPRPTDNQWTFGKLNKQTGYLEIASVRIHRIIATAFHGEPPTNEHVVDHIDTNKQNNRPNNLRWVTRLENILLNPITAKRIELVCGSLEEFLADPSKFRNRFPEPNYEWMCTVDVEEAQASKKRLLEWAKSDKPLQGGTLGEWIYNRNLPKVQIEKMPQLSNSLTQNTKQKNWKTPSELPYFPQEIGINPIEEVSQFIISSTQNAKQKNWRTPAEFPCCPQEIGINPILSYGDNLKVGKTFAQNQYSKSIIEEFTISKDESAIWILCRIEGESVMKPYSLAEVTYENEIFIHNSLGSFFVKEGAKKQFILAQGLEWSGGETYDESCG